MLTPSIVAAALVRIISRFIELIAGILQIAQERLHGCDDVWTRCACGSTTIRDGARVAYRETGTGPGLALLHSLGLSHREWEPIVDPLAARFRVVLPDLPLHGDSEDRPRHPYTVDWLTDVMAGFCKEVVGPAADAGGPRPRGRAGAPRGQLADRLEPARLVLMPNRLHRRDEFAGRARGVARGLPGGGGPGA